VLFRSFEQETLTQVIEARAKATQTTIDPTNLSPEKIAQFQKAQGELSGAIGRLLVTVEKYPELKATEAFRDLQAQLEGTENRIKVSRNDFNDAVKDYNTTVKKFPMVLFAGIFGFQEKGYFAADAGAEKAPTVNYNGSTREHIWIFKQKGTLLQQGRGGTDGGSHPFC